MANQYKNDNPEVYTHNLNLDHYERIRRKIEDGMIQPSEMSQSNSPVQTRRHQSGKNVSSFTGFVPIELKTSEVSGSGSIALRQRVYESHKKQRRAPQYKSSTMTVSNNLKGKFSSNMIIPEEDSFD